MPARHTTAIFIAKANKVHNNFFSYEKTNYVNAKEKVIVTCPKHGDWESIPGNHLFGAGCRKCADEANAKNQMNDVGDFIRQCKKVHKGKYTYDNINYLGLNHPLVVTCPIHGDFKQRPSNHLKGHGCGKCKAVKSSQAMSLTHDEFVLRASKVHLNKYTYPETYSHGHKYMVIMCKEHGEFEQMPYSHLAGHGCPFCSGATSQVEHKVADMISKHCKVIRGSKRIIAPLQLDIYVPEKKLAVEINGNYWHSEDHKSPRYHYDKVKMCADKRIRLYQFWTSDIEKHPKIVSSILRNALGKSRTVYARNTEVRQVTSKEAKVFFKQTHLQGFASAHVYYGLYLDGTLLTCMSFGKPRFTESYEWELVRLSTALDHVVVGGASKLFAHFLKVHNPDSILSYADLMISKGDVYKILGFKKVHTSDPGFFWQKRESIVSRYKAQKHRLQSLLGAEYNPKLSASANMRAAGFVKIYDAGNLVFEYRT